MKHCIDLKEEHAERCRTCIFGTVHYFNQCAIGKVINLSSTEVSLVLAAPLHAAEGSKVSIKSDDLGCIEGTVTSRQDACLTVEMRLSTNSLAKVSSYFRFFHPIKPPCA